MSPRAWSREAVDALGVRTNLETAISVLGLGRTLGFELARAGEFPVPVFKVRSIYIVPVAPLKSFLGLTDTQEPLARVAGQRPGSDQTGRDEDEPDAAVQAAPGSTTAAPTKDGQDHGRTHHSCSTNIRRIDGR